MCSFLHRLSTMDRPFLRSSGIQFVLGVFCCHVLVSLQASLRSLASHFRGLSGLHSNKLPVNMPLWRSLALAGPSAILLWRNGRTLFFFAYRLPRNVIWEGNASKPIPNMKLSYIYSLANGLFFFYNTQQLYNQWLISQITLRDAKTGYYFCQEMGEGLYLFNYILPFLWRQTSLNG